MVHNSEHSQRATAYGGDRTHVTPPGGGTATTTIKNARGNVSEVRHYHGPKPSGEYGSMLYGNTFAGQLASVTDDAGNVWSYEYDLRGRRIVTDDPDAGVSETVYDEAYQVVSTSDAPGEALSYTYDVLAVAPRLVMPAARC